MLVRPETAFPHPVLSIHTGDYRDGHFDLELEIEEVPSAGKVSITGRALLDDAHARALIESGQAMLGVACECLGTFFMDFCPVPLDGFTLEFPEGELRGKVDLQGLIAVTAESVTLGSPAIDPTFPPHTRRVEAGTPIAASPIHSFEAGLDKLASMEAIFSLSSSDQIEPGQFAVDLDNERIRIVVSADLYPGITSIRGSSSTKDILHAALYLPALISVLEAMRAGDHEDRRWHIIVSARCRAQGIDINNKDLVQAAQTLLGNPLTSLVGALEKES